jgi:hypothetical protein
MAAVRSSRQQGIVSASTSGTHRSKNTAHSTTAAPDASFLAVAGTGFNVEVSAI